MKSLFTILLLTTISQQIILAQKIDQVRKNTKKKDNIVYYYGPSDSSSESSSNNNSSFFGAIILGAIISIVPSEKELEKKYGAPMGLQYYPYMEKGSGKYTRNQTTTTRNTVELQGGFYYESLEIQGLNVEAQVNISRKISFTANSISFREKIQDKQADLMSTLNLNGKYHLFTYTGLDVWLGGGFSHLFLEQGFSGANLNIGTEIYIAKPVSIYTNWYFAGLSDEVSYTQGSLNLKVYIKESYLNLGYQSTTVTGVNFNGITFGYGIII